MIYFSKVGTNENIGYETMPKEIPLGYIQMDKERPTIEHIAQEGGVWALPQPNTESIRKNFSDALRAIMDSKAQEHGYDSVLTAVTYENSSVEKFQKEGKAFRLWRDTIYDTAYAYLKDCLKGLKELPKTNEELLELVPKFEIME